MRIYNAAITGSSVECEVTAHNSPIAVMAWNQDASLLASASSKGTVLRVHRMPQVLDSSELSPEVVHLILSHKALISQTLCLAVFSVVKQTSPHQTALHACAVAVMLHVKSQIVVELGAIG